MSLTKVSSVCLGFHDNTVLAFVLSPINISTSAGLKYLGLVLIIGFPLSLKTSCPLSSYLIFNSSKHFLIKSDLCIYRLQKHKPQR